MSDQGDQANRRPSMMDKSSENVGDQLDMIYKEASMPGCSSRMNRGAKQQPPEVPNVKPKARVVFPGRFVTTVVRTMPVEVWKRFVKPMVASAHTSPPPPAYMLNKLFDVEDLENVLLLVTPTSVAGATMKHTMHCYQVVGRCHLGVTTLTQRELQHFELYQGSENYAMMHCSCYLELEDAYRSSLIKCRLFEMLRTKCSTIVRFRYKGKNCDLELRSCNPNVETDSERSSSESSIRTESKTLNVVYSPHRLRESTGTLCLPTSIPSVSVNSSETLLEARSSVFEELTEPVPVPKHFSQRARDQLQANLNRVNAKQAYANFGRLIENINNADVPHHKDLQTFFMLTDVLDIKMYVRHEFKFFRPSPSKARFRMDCFMFDDRRDFVVAIFLPCKQLKEFATSYPRLKRNLRYVDDAFELTTMPKRLTNGLKSLLDRLHARPIFNLLAELTFERLQPPPMLESLMLAQQERIERQRERKRLEDEILRQVTLMEETLSLYDDDDDDDESYSLTEIENAIENSQSQTQTQTEN